jgi:hypothetical protein
MHQFEKKYKIVVFVPPDETDRLTFAMAKEGAGKIGNYTVCSFRMQGTGTFEGGSSANPRVGKKGKFEKVKEVRLEMLCDEKYLNNAVDKMLAVHPYEEPAYEIYEVLVKSRSPLKRDETKVVPSTRDQKLKIL